MFTVGDRVVYRAEGVCRISDIRAESFGSIGNTAMYYILTPMKDEKSTLFVPVGNPQLAGMMRPLLSAHQIAELSAQLRACRMEWIPETRLRNHRFREILGVGDRRELVVLVHTLRERIERAVADGKKVTATDEDVFHQACKLLLSEFSATTDLTSEEELLATLSGERMPNPKQ